MAPRFSVILCTYNRCNFVLTTLASLRRQTVPYDEFEVIVVDNGSTDGTLTMVQAYVGASLHPERKPEETWRVLCISEPRSGLAYARAAGLQAAAGEIAVFLDDDVIADPFLLEQMQEAFEKTGADAVGGRVELRWEAPRPHWLPQDLLDVLGYYALQSQRVQLPNEMCFSNSVFSVKVEALRRAGAFSPFVSRREHFPANMECEDLCRRLREEGCALWYEPNAVVLHRVTAPLLRRSYFVGRAYWQGRSEVLAQYNSERLHASERKYTLRGLRRVLRHELREMLSLGLLHRPLMRLARRPGSERLEAAMAQARIWGHLRQHLAFFEHAPLDFDVPSVLLVRPVGRDASVALLVEGLRRQDVPCLETSRDIPLSWLWRHRAAQGRATGIIHFYRPGALNFSYRQRRRLWFRLWLAQFLGIRIASTDAGGWWQSTRGPRFLSRRLLERKLLYTSDVIFAFSRQPEQLYRDKRLRRRARCLPHPGLRDHYSFIDRDRARVRLGLPAGGFVFLCLAGAHTESELVRLIEAFGGASKGDDAPEAPALLIAGAPGDKPRPSGRILRLAARHPNVYLFTAAPSDTDMSLYLGAANALVLPHFALPGAGALDPAMLAFSYGLMIVAPDLPRFRGMLPPEACVLYDPTRRASLIQAFQKAPRLRYALSDKEKQALDAASGWNQYVQRLLKIYRRVLG